MTSAPLLPITVPMSAVTQQTQGEPSGHGSWVNISPQHGPFTTGSYFVDGKMRNDYCSPVLDLLVQALNPTVRRNLLCQRSPHSALQLAKLHVLFPCTALAWVTMDGLQSNPSQENDTIEWDLATLDRRVGIPRLVIETYLRQASSLGPRVIIGTFFARETRRTSETRAVVTDLLALLRRTYYKHKKNPDDPVGPTDEWATGGTDALELALKVAAIPLAWSTEGLPADYMAYLHLSIDSLALGFLSRVPDTLEQRTAPQQAYAELVAGLLGMHVRIAPDTIQTYNDVMVHVARCVWLVGAALNHFPRDSSGQAVPHGPGRTTLKASDFERHMPSALGASTAVWDVLDCPLARYSAVCYDAALVQALTAQAVSLGSEAVRHKRIVILAARWPGAAALSLVFAVNPMATQNPYSQRYLKMVLLGLATIYGLSPEEGAALETPQQLGAHLLKPYALVAALAAEEFVPNMR